MKFRIKTLAAFAMLMLLSCSRGAEPINYGKDQCAYCKMTIMDKKYGCEVLNDKGKAFKFDDVVCMRAYLGENSFPVKNIYVSSYVSTGFIDAEKAVYLKHPHFRSPMNGNIAAFSNAAEAGKLKDSLKLSLLNWGSF